MPTPPTTIRKDKCMGTYVSPTPGTYIELFPLNDDWNGQSPLQIYLRDVTDTTMTSGPYTGATIEELEAFTSDLLNRGWTYTTESISDLQDREDARQGQDFEKKSAFDPAKAQQYYEALRDMATHPGGSDEWEEAEAFRKFRNQAKSALTTPVAPSRTR